MSKHTLLARQPIFDRDLNVIAYELLFRNPAAAQGDSAAHVSDDNRATASVLVNLFMEAGMAHVLGDRRAFINVGREFITDTAPLPLPADRIVLEVLETVNAEREVTEGLKRLAEQGFTIALDDFEFQPELAPLMDMAEIVKIDVWNKTEQQVREDLDRWSGHAKVKRLAEKVETQEEFRRYRDMGFDYFQGYFFARPEIISGRKTPSNQLTTLKLLAELRKPNTEIADIDRIIRLDATLSFKLLRYINSARFAISRRVESVREALTFIGIEPLRRWIMIMSLISNDGTPGALISNALVRARMCENLAEASGASSPDMYFTVGLFSALDGILKTSMETIIQDLPLEETINDALLNHQGDMGQALNCALAHELPGDQTPEYQSLSPEQMSAAYLEALAWAGGVEKDMDL